MDVWTIGMNLSSNLLVRWGPRNQICGTIMKSLSDNLDSERKCCVIVNCYWQHYTAQNISNTFNISGHLRKYPEKYAYSKVSLSFKRVSCACKTSQHVGICHLHLWEQKAWLYEERVNKAIIRKQKKQLNLQDPRNIMKLLQGWRRAISGRGTKQKIVHCLFI